MARTGTGFTAAHLVELPAAAAVCLGDRFWHSPDFSHFFKIWAETLFKNIFKGSSWQFFLKPESVHWFVLEQLHQQGLPQTGQQQNRRPFSNVFALFFIGFLTG